MLAAGPRTLSIRGGGKVVAISDLSGAIYNKDGIDVPVLMRYSREQGSIKGFPGADRSPPTNFCCRV